MNEFPIELDWVPTLYPNKMDAHPIVLKFDEKGTDLFNRCVDWCHENIAPKANAQWTPSGGLKKSNEMRLHGCYGFPKGSNMVKELVIYHKGLLGKVQCVKGRKDPDSGSKIRYGRDAFRIFNQTLLRHGVDLEDFAENDMEKALAIKRTIPSMMIWMDPDIIGKTLFDVHHMDLNSAFPSGMCVAYPQLRPAIEELYAKRKDKNDPEHDDMKNVLNMTWGYLQCYAVKFKWSAISKAALEWSNDFIEQKIALLRESGARVLGVNTDGIWYQKKELYHDADEGTWLCQWKHDHKFCRFRAKSAGGYEYVEDGEYHPVQRGQTKLEKIKPRELWEWGDLFDFKCKVVEPAWDTKTEHLVFINVEEC